MDTLITFRDLLEIMSVYVAGRIFYTALLPYALSVVKRIENRIAIWRCFKQ